MQQLNKIFCSLLLSFSVLACDTTQARQAVNDVFQNEPKKDKGKKEKKADEPASDQVTVLQKWDLPAVLNEVSGIVYLGDHKFACVEDEDGTIFIYNTNTAKIEKEIKFGAAGDYEGLALVGKTAYVMRSDGKIFEVKDYTASSPVTQMYDTPLTAKNNVEGLTYDRQHNRLLLAIKGAETSNQTYKGIYAFDLKTKKLQAEPVIKLNLADPVFAESKGQGTNKALQPSEIAVNPINGNIYITEATNPQLLILNSSGAIKARYKLSKSAFNQPEGITFSPTGDLYISNEGGKGNANILKVKIN